MGFLEVVLQAEEEQFRPVMGQYRRRLEELRGSGREER